MFNSTQLNNNNNNDDTPFLSGGGGVRATFSSLMAATAIRSSPVVMYTAVAGIAGIAVIFFYGADS
ncbi:hypothetical protein Lalb_Chr08g0239901 [Lupinus albus]|uniref:Transmembrane protein n=1 Tax=Lupinus albus TaxID=3870 RepID=A0A6A4Q5R1_LUPAL|nr:hypothetical protein Lalb_Chr08g0239901 [Lupinus albus]